MAHVGHSASASASCETTGRHGGKWEALASLDRQGREELVGRGVLSCDGITFLSL